MNTSTSPNEDMHGTSFTPQIRCHAIVPIYHDTRKHHLTIRKDCEYYCQIIS